MSAIVELVEVAKSFSGNHVLHDINLEVANGELVTLLGPSGCGKTTLLRLISGFEKPNMGRVYINGRDVTDTPPQQRYVNMVFQNYALFPHMTVFDNVSFGLRCQRLPHDIIEQRVRQALEMVKLEGHMLRRPEQLSGGQQQRVAIARAIVNEPLVLLFDEPLSSLDYRLRKNMQIELKQLQRKLGISFIFVTHDQEEALSMSDRVVVLHEGRITQIGTPREVYEKPVNLTVANFIGEVNIFDVEVLVSSDNNIEVEIEGVRLELKNSQNFKTGEHIHVLMRPEDLRVYDRTEVTDTSEMVAGNVEEVIYKGSTVDLMVKLASGRIVAATEFFNEDDEDLVYTIGEAVWVYFTQGWEVVLPYEE